MRSFGTPRGRARRDGAIRAVPPEPPTPIAPASFPCECDFFRRCTRARLNVEIASFRSLPSDEIVRLWPSGWFESTSSLLMFVWSVLLRVFGVVETSTTTTSTYTSTSTWCDSIQGYRYTRMWNINTFIPLWTFRELQVPCLKPIVIYPQWNFPWKWTSNIGLSQTLCNPLCWYIYLCTRLHYHLKSLQLC